MNFKKFSRIWIAKHIPTSELYGDRIGESVTQLVDLMIEQKHSGASFAATLSFFIRLVEGYRNQEEL